MPRRPHRRDRRRPSPNTPGGAIGPLSALLVIDTATDNRFSLLLVKPAPLKSGVPFDYLDTAAVPQIDFSDWKITDINGVAYTIDNAEMDDAGLIEIEMTADRLLDVYLTIPAYQNQFEAQTGYANPGGTFLVPLE